MSQLREHNAKEGLAGMHPHLGCHPPGALFVATATGVDLRFAEWGTLPR